MEESPITAATIREWTKRDPVLSKVYGYLQHGWPGDILSEVKLFHSVKDELSTLQGCILRDSRVLVPPPGRKQVLLKFHEGHPGICRMKSIAQMYTWWPGMDREIEELVKSCENCRQIQPSPPRAPLQPWSWPSKPWARIHLDYAGPVENKMFLVVVDAHTKWMEVCHVASSTSAATITH